MPAQYGEKYILVVGTSLQVLAEFNMAVFWALSAAVFRPSKQNNLSDLLNHMLFTMLYLYVISCVSCVIYHVISCVIYHVIYTYDIYLMQNAVCLLNFLPRGLTRFLWHVCLQQLR